MPKLTLKAPLVIQPAIEASEVDVISATITAQYDPALGEFAITGVDLIVVEGVVEGKAFRVLRSSPLSIPAAEFSDEATKGLAALKALAIKYVANQKGYEA